LSHAQQGNYLFDCFSSCCWQICVDDQENDNEKKMEAAAQTTGDTNATRYIYRPLSLPRQHISQKDDYF
jgi:hypothetical protein